MLSEPNCHKRRCKWYVGVIEPDGTEGSETHFCGAFPAGIPREIAYGENKHDAVMDGQVKPYIYEIDPDWDNHWDNLPEDDRDLFRKINAEGSLRRAVSAVDEPDDEDKNGRMLWELAWELINSDQRERAVLVSRQLVSFRPDNPASYNTLGIALLGLNELAQAKQCIVKSMELGLNNARSLLLASDICAALGEFEEQLFWAKKANEAESDNVRTYLAVAEAHCNLGDNGAVETTLKKAIKIDPKCTDAHRMLAKHYCSLRRFGDACDRYWAAVQIQPDDATLWTDLGCVMCDMKEYANALNAYRKALDLKPGDSMYLNNVGYAHLALKKFNEAVPFLRKALEVNPGERRAHLNLTNALGEAQRYEECVQASLTALGDDLEMKKGINNFALHVTSNLGLGYANQGKYEEAEKCFRRNLRLVAPTYYNLGLTLHKQKRYEDALVYLQRAVEIEPDDAGFLCLLGYNYFKLHRLDEAQEILFRAIAADGNHAQAHYDLAVVYAAMGGHEDAALDCYNRVVAINKDHAYAYYGIACIHALQDRKDMALQFLETSLSKGYCDASHITEDPDWDSLRGDTDFNQLVHKYLGSPGEQQSIKAA